mmetsp:Transcript_24362/g.76395  ORF Transcript_24362/g.76395 Transcript_24362/m.76395 type:complete len:407 (-) Transcript_24362:1140-2360(-)
MRAWCSRAFGRCLRGFRFRYAGLVNFRMQSLLAPFRIACRHVQSLLTPHGILRICGVLRIHGILRISGCAVRRRLLRFTLLLLSPASLLRDAPPRHLLASPSALAKKPRVRAVAVLADLCHVVHASPLSLRQPRQPVLSERLVHRRAAGIFLGSVLYHGCVLAHDDGLVRNLVERVGGVPGVGQLFLLGGVIVTHVSNAFLVGLLHRRAVGTGCYPRGKRSNSVFADLIGDVRCPNPEEGVLRHHMFAFSVCLATKANAGGALLPRSQGSVALCRVAAVISHIQILLLEGDSLDLQHPPALLRVHHAVSDEHGRLGSDRSREAACYPFGTAPRTLCGGFYIIPIVNDPDAGAVAARIVILPRPLWRGRRRPPVVIERREARVVHRHSSGRRVSLPFCPGNPARLQP